MDNKKPNILYVNRRQIWKDHYDFQNTDKLLFNVFFCEKLQFRFLVVNYFIFFWGAKTALLYLETNSPFFELK